MADPDRSLLGNMLAHLRAQRPELCRHWFDQIDPAGLDGGVLRLRIAEPVRRSYLQRQCAGAFTEAAQAVSGRLLSVRFLDQTEPAAPQTKGSGNGAASRPPAAPHRSRDELPFNPDYTFEQFVVGPGARLAHAAATAIAGQPGAAYNPLFVHGGVGLGKSHLLQAICQRLWERTPGISILYISCEGFITRFMDAVQAGQMADFRHAFRDVDVLVIDDIHFLAKRDRTQEEFFHTFNTLYQAKRQIVLSSDAPPDQIPDLEARLVSRFQWGLVAPVEPPDYETRVAILKHKARIRGVEIPDETACFIAARVDSNIRELEGALTRLQMQAHLADSPLSVEIAKQALGARHESGQKQTTIETIVAAVTDHYDVTLSNLQSKKRHRSIALPRQVCMYLARRHTRYSLEEIGGYFGGRDHTTVLHAVRTVGKQADTDTGFRESLTALSAKVAQS